MSGLDGRVYLVTGGTGALGRAVVQALLERGASVAVPYRSGRRWDELQEKLGRRGGLWGAPAELADLSAADEFVARALQRFGRLDGLAAVAGGYAGSGPFEQAPVTEWFAMMSTNLAPAYAICRAALPRLLEGGGGSVVTVAARLALEGGAGAAAYAVSKAAVVALTRVLALENRDRGVRFNCVTPAIIDTPDNRAAMPQADPAGWTSPAAIAEVIAFLLSPASAPMTGSVVPVDLPA